MPSAFLSLELHTSYDKSSHKTCTVAWTCHACRRQHMLAEAVTRATASLSCSLISSCHLNQRLIAAPCLHRFFIEVRIVHADHTLSCPIMQQNTKPCMVTYDLRRSNTWHDKIRYSADDGLTPIRAYVLTQTSTVVQVTQNLCSILVIVCVLMA